jgi:hypothetical protein
MRQERIDEAADLRKRIDDTREAHKRMLEKEKAQKWGGKEEPDFRNPTPEMIKDAKERGIDLTDPRVVDMLTNMKEEKKRKAGIPTAAPAAAASAMPKHTPEYQKETRAKLSEMIGDMPSKDLVRSLREMNCEFDENGTNDYLKHEFITALISGKQIPDSLRNANDPKHKSWWINLLLQTFGQGSTSWWGNLRVAFIFATLSIGYKILFGGMGGGVLGRGGYKLKERIPIVEEASYGVGGVGGAGFDEEEW